MTEPSANHELAPRHAQAPLTLPAATVLGWTIASLLNTAVMRATGLGAYRSRGAVDDVLLHVYDIGQSTLLGVLIAAILAALARWQSAPARTQAAVTCLVTAGLGIAFLRHDLDGPASLLSAADSDVPVLVLSALLALVVPAAGYAASKFRLGRWRAVPALAVVAGVVANHVVLPGDYAGAHMLLGATTATVAAASLVGVRLLPARVTRAIVGVVAVTAATTVIVAVPHRIAPALALSWSRSLAPVLPRSRITAHPIPVEDAYRPAENAAQVPPSTPRVASDDVIVIYYSVDSLRADLLDEASHERFAHLRALRADSVDFARAQAPSTRTSQTLASVMTGKYSCQLLWKRRRFKEANGKAVRSYYPHRDESVRFPRLLRDAGIATVQYGQAVQMSNRFGIASGFEEEYIVKPRKGKPSTKKKWSTGNDVLPRIFARLSEHERGSLFVFFHDLDTHSPFNLGRKKKGSAKDRYESEMELVDRRIGRLRRYLKKQGLDRRTVLIVTGDHGEAFSEHGTSFHGQNLYDEQMHVPLWIHVPSVSARRVSDYVTLMDLGPTILDLMGVPTPGHFMGQSLVPYLSGQAPKLERPILAEVRTKEAVVLPSGLKFIHDVASAAREVYDLGTDPEERDNLYDDLQGEAEAEFAKLEAFFRVHCLKRDGYSDPFKKGAR